MKKKKLELKDLEIKSFVTSAEKEDLEVRGGSGGTCDPTAATKCFVCPPYDPTPMTICFVCGTSPATVCPPDK